VECVRAAATHGERDGSTDASHPDRRDRFGRLAQAGAPSSIHICLPCLTCCQRERGMRPGSGNPRREGREHGCQSPGQGPVRTACTGWQHAAGTRGRLTKRCGDPWNTLRGPVAGFPRPRDRDGHGRGAPQEGGPRPLHSGPERLRPNPTMQRRGLRGAGGPPGRRKRSQSDRSAGPRDPRPDRGRAGLGEGRRDGSADRGPASEGR